MATASGNMQSLVDGLRGSLLVRQKELRSTVEQTREALRDFRSRQQTVASDLHEKADALREELAAKSRARKETHDTDTGVRTEERERRRIQVSELRSGVYSRLGRYKMERRDNAKKMQTRLADELGSIRDEVHQKRSTAKAWQHETSEAFQSRMSDELGVLRDLTQEIRSAARQFLQEGGEIRQTFASNLRKTLMEGRQDLSETVSGLRGMLHREAEQLRGDLKEAQDIWFQHTQAGTGGKRPVSATKETGHQASTAAPDTAEPMAEPEKSSPVESAFTEFDEDDLFAVIANHPEGIKLVDIGAELKTEWRGLIGLARSLVESGRVEKRKNCYFQP